jgi:hypothetical protein
MVYAIFQAFDRTLIRFVIWEVKKLYNILERRTG